MAEANMFALKGELMEFILQLLRDGKPIPPSTFKNIIIEKCRLVNHHFDKTRKHLRLAANVTDTTATITFYDNYIEDSKLTTTSISNTPTLEAQLIQLWRDVQSVLKHFNEEDRIAERASIESYYWQYKLKQEWAELLTYEF